MSAAATLQRVIGRALAAAACDLSVTSLPEPSDLTGVSCQARAINNTGQVAGICVDTSGNGHLVQWQNGTVTDLGSVGSIGTLSDLEAVSMNSSGQIVGRAATGTAFVVQQRHDH